MLEKFMLRLVKTALYAFWGKHGRIKVYAKAFCQNVADAANIRMKSVMFV